MKWLLAPFVFLGLKIWELLCSPVGFVIWLLPLMVGTMVILGLPLALPALLLLPESGLTFLGVDTTWFPFLSFWDVVRASIICFCVGAWILGMGIALYAWSRDFFLEIVPANWERTKEILRL